MPYKIENNSISFIFVFNNETNKLYFYFYNFDMNEGINKPNIIIFDNINIQNKTINHSINNNGEKSLYYNKIFINDMNLIRVQ